MWPFPLLHWIVRICIKDRLGFLHFSLAWPQWNWDVHYSRTENWKALLWINETCFADPESSSRTWTEDYWNENTCEIWLPQTELKLDCSDSKYSRIYSMFANEVGKDFTRFREAISLDQIIDLLWIPLWALKKRFNMAKKRRCAIVSY